MLPMNSIGQAICLFALAQKTMDQLYFPLGLPGLLGGKERPTKNCSRFCFKIRPPKL